MSNRTLYAYERFSTPEQVKGDSHRRQEGKAATYAKQHGLVLDTEFALQDHGVSAFRGRNFEKGALGQFRRLLMTAGCPRARYWVPRTWTGSRARIDGMRSS